VATHLVPSTFAHMIQTANVEYTEAAAAKILPLELVVNKALPMEDLVVVVAIDLDTGVFDLVEWVLHLSQNDDQKKAENFVVEHELSGILVRTEWKTVMALALCHAQSPQRSSRGRPCGSGDVTSKRLQWHCDPSSPATLILIYFRVMS
jgi:hypothetical protein